MDACAQRCGERKRVFVQWKRGDLYTHASGNMIRAFRTGEISGGAAAAKGSPA